MVNIKSKVRCVLLNTKCDVLRSYLRSYWSHFLQFQWTVRLVTAHPLVQSLTHTFCCRSGVDSAERAEQAADVAKKMVAMGEAEADKAVISQGHIELVHQLNDETSLLSTVHQIFESKSIQAHRKLGEDATGPAEGSQCKTRYKYTQQTSHLDVIEQQAS